MRSKEVANSIYLKKYAKQQVNEKSPDRILKKKKGSKRQRQGRVGNGTTKFRQEKSNSLEAVQNSMSNSLNNDKMSVLLPNSNSNGIKSQKVGSEIHNSKISEEQKSYCASIQEKPACLESSLK